MSDRANWPADMDQSEIGHGLGWSRGWPATSRMVRCPCGAYHWLGSDGAAVSCECGRSWAQTRDRAVVEVTGC